MSFKCSFTLSGHTGRVVALAGHQFLPLLVSGPVFPDYAVRVWDLETRRCIRELVGHWNTVYCLALDSAGRRIASGSIGIVKLWDFDSGACLRTLDGHGMSYVNAVAWDAAGLFVASGAGATVRVWHADSGALRHSLKGHASGVRALVAHPTEDLLASGSADRTVRVWRWSSGECLRTLAGHTAVVTSLAASAAWLVSGSVDQRVRVWSWASGECARVLDGFAGYLDWNSLAWRDSALVTLESDGTVRMWDTSSEDPSAWSCVGSLASKASSACGVAVVGGGCVACAAPHDRNMIAVWDVFDAR